MAAAPAQDGGARARAAPNAQGAAGAPSRHSAAGSTAGRAPRPAGARAARNRLPGIPSSLLPHPSALAAKARAAPARRPPPVRLPARRPPYADFIAPPCNAAACAGVAVHASGCSTAPRPRLWPPHTRLHAGREAGRTGSIDGGSGPARTFDSVLRDIRSRSTGPRDLGDRFERIILDVLRRDRHYRNRFDLVQTWRDWARENHVKETVGTGQDLGIDIVARERVGGELCAVQCKCYADDTVLDAAPVNSFLAAGVTYRMKNYILACTGPINKAALAKLRGARCQIMTRDDLRYKFDWGAYPEKVVPPPPKKLMHYQKRALGDVISGFSENSRGKLIMACGTGKTLVSLHAAERLAGRGGVVLYLVPSISLILQSMREWSDNANMPHYYMAVCSDKTVRNAEQGTLTELEAPASTDPRTLGERAGRMRGNALNVIFSTYHSVEVVEKAMAGRKLDLVLCDEAHRTAGVDEHGSESYYTRVHYDRNIRAARRLYMTATPRIYTDAVKGRAEQQQKVVVSMDDDLYGPVFHSLSFYDAVHKHKVLCDFKVRVAVMDGDTLDELVQRAQAGDDSMVPLDEKTLMASVWHALEHPGADDKKGLLQRVIMFCDMINSSKILAGERINYKRDVREDPAQLEEAMRIDAQRSFEKIVSHIKKVTRARGRNRVDVKHVDGGDSAQDRRARLEWLKSSGDDPSTCRILSNARCLSEGVDVPALDGVVFMNPRKSVVDVVQAVGRVMRKSPGKEFGYVILPVAIPAGVDINDGMEHNEYFKVVWQVLNALRSHDPQLASEINKLELTGFHSDSEVTNRIIIRHAYGHGLWQAELLGPKMIGGIASKLVQKVGDVNYYDKYGKRLGETARTIESRIRNKMEANPKYKAEVKRLHSGLHQMVGDSITFDETVRVLAQHMVLAGVFDQLFSGEFTTRNPIAQVLESVAAKIGLREELRGLGDFYDDIRRELSGIETREARQSFIKKIYGNFLESADKKGAEKHGIVYTPVEVIDFIIHSVDVLLKKHFNLSLNNRRVKVLDPFVGTGTFLTRLLESGLITGNLYEKYRHDLLANELILLAYYIATVNIETTYSSLRKGGRYVPFAGISYTDTLQINPRYREGGHHRQEQSKIDERFQAAHKRIKYQRGSHIHVIIGNPPYSAGQSNYNDENQNIVYPGLDARIKATYLKRTNAQRKASLYDSYIRALRWASDRIGQSGIIAVITNAGFLRSDPGAGIRASLEEEFSEIWCFDLRGNQRTQGDVSRREGGKIFGAESRAAVAITLLVKKPHKKDCSIHYYDIGDYLTREQKLHIIKELKSIEGIKEWDLLKPDSNYDWLDQRRSDFRKYDAMGVKRLKPGEASSSIFHVHSGGVATSRDAWAYNASIDQLEANMKRHIDYCNSQNLDNPIIDSKQGKWGRGLSQKIKKNKPQYDSNKIRIASYRPFFKQYLYFDSTRLFNNEIYQIPKLFPENETKNLTIVVPYKFVGELSVLVTDITPDLELIHHGQCFSFYRYVVEGKKDNITDVTLLEYRRRYKNSTITKLDIFYYIYGMLHQPEYKKKFAANLIRELPRVPMAPDFTGFCNAGKKLADLHVGFETCTRYDLGQPKFRPAKFSKLSFATRRDKATGKNVKDRTTIRIDGAVLFDNVPETTYKVNGRTPLEWAIDRYRLTTDRDSGITNDPCTGTDIVAVIERAVYIGIESERIIKTLPDKFEPSSVWKPKEGGLREFS